MCCVAVLAVTYKTDKPGTKPDLVIVDSEDSLQEKIREIERRPELVKIRVLRASYDIERIVDFRQTPYVGQNTESSTGIVQKAG